MAMGSVAAAALLGAGLGYAGAAVAPRWIPKPLRAWEAPLVAVVNGTLIGLLALDHPWDGYFWQHLVFLSILTIASFIDLHERIIPNELVLLGLAAGVILMLVAPYPDKGWGSALGGAAIGFFTLFLLAVLVKGGMGFGDVKLAAVIGLFLGHAWVAMGLVLAIFAGGLVGGVLLMFRLVGRKDHIPFGPFLAVGAAATVLFGLPIWIWYTSI